MKKLIFLLCCGCSLVLTSCSNEDDVFVPQRKGVTYKVTLASPIDIEKIANSSDSTFNVAVNIRPVSGNTLQTKSVVEEVIPSNAVLTHRRGVATLTFASFWGQMLCDVWTLSVTVNYAYGQWVNGHTGPNTGYAPGGTVKSVKTQKAEQNKKDDNSGSWTFSTASYYPLSNYLGQVSPDCNKWYPFHYNQLELYYTWIDGNN